jgi:hypothetical protein
MKRMLLIPLLIACLPGCSDTTEPDVPSVSTPRFEDVSTGSGIDLVMTSGSLPSSQIIEVNGGGLALLDYDGDGDLDLFIANGATLEQPDAGPGSRLYENVTTGDTITFRDATGQAGIQLQRWAMGAAAGDYDGDGHVDLYVTCHGPNVLLRNRGDGRFEDVTDTTGTGDSGWGTSAAFADIDGDNDLDLFVVNYLQFDPSHPPPPATYKGQQVMSGPHGLPPQRDVLFENLGDGTFRDAELPSVDPACGLNLVVLDLDGDGHLDVLVGNDSQPNHLFLNTGTGLKMVEQGQHRGIASNRDGHDQATMGMAVADVDGDLRPDIFTSNFSSDTNTLHLGLGADSWDDRTSIWGLGLSSRAMLGWGSVFCDFDLDGDEDLLIVNGHVYPQATLDTMDSEYEQPPLLMVRNGSRFHRATPGDTGNWITPPHRDRNAVIGDLDRDGDMDVIIGELNGPVRVLRNTTRSPRTGIVLSLRDDRPGSLDRYGPGSRLQIHAGEETSSRWIPAGGSFQSTNAPGAHVSIPPGIEGFDVEVTWPDGITEHFRNIAPAPAIILERGSGTP